MAFTLTPNLGLRLDSNLTANASYNLKLLDTLGGVTTVDTTGTVHVRGQLGLIFTANDPAVGGSGTGGTVVFGSAGDPLTSFTVWGPVSAAQATLQDLAPTAGNLTLLYNSTAGSQPSNPGTWALTLNVNAANRILDLGGNLLTAGGSISLTTPSSSAVTLPVTGTLATLTGAEALTNKFLSGTLNTFSNIPYSALVLTGQIVNADVSPTAAIAYSKLALTGQVVNSDISAGAAISYSKLALTGQLLNSDISPFAAIAGSKIQPTFGNQTVSTSSGLSLIGPGAFSVGLTAPLVGQSANWTLQLPVSPGVAGQVLTTDGTGRTYWGAGGGGGGNGEFAATWTTGTSITLDHGLNTADIEVQVYDVATGTNALLVSIVRTDANHVALTASAAPPAGGWRVVVLAAGGSSGGGGVSSVGLVASPEFVVTGSPVTGAGTLTFSSVTQNPNTFWAGPTSGAPAQPAFRTLAPADLSSVTTDALPEGVSSLYFTTARAQAAISATAPLVDTAGTLSIPQATGSVSGFLASTDWTTFNSKQAAGAYISALTGDVTATGPGSAASTVAFVSGQSAASVAAAAAAVASSTTLDTPGTLVLRDSSGNFSAGTITATLTGNVSGSAASFTGSLAGNVTGTQGSTVVASVGGQTAAAVATAATSVAAATNLDTVSTLVLRDGSGNFSAGTVNANLVGNTSGGALTVTGGTAASGGNGGQVTVAGASGSGTGAGGTGGQVLINGGAANGNNTTNNGGGAISLTAGNSIGSATGGTVTISSGNGGIGTGTAGATGGTTNVNGGTGGAGSSTSGNGGGATLKGGSGGGGVAGGQGGQASLTGGTGGTGSSTGGNGGSATVTGGSPGSVAGSAGGSVTIGGGNGTSTGSGGAGGSITIATGQANGDNTVNNGGGSLTLSVGKSFGSSGGANVNITAGTGGVGTSTTGANGGNAILTAGAGGVGSSTGGTGGSLQFNAGTGGNSGTPGAGGIIQFFTGTGATVTEHLRIQNTGEVLITNGDLQVGTLGFGLQVKSGVNAKIGTATLAAGTVTVANTSVTSNSRIFVTSNTDGGTPGWLRVSAKTNGTSFVITSSSSTDTSTVAWLIVESM